MVIAQKIKSIIKFYFNILLDLILGIISLDIDIDDTGRESPFKWVNKIKKSLVLPLENYTIEEKLNITFLLSNPVNIGIKLDLNQNNYTLINSGNNAQVLKFFN